MELWTLYNYIVNTVHKFMLDKDQCLYNAMVLTMVDKTDSELIAIRNCAYEWAEFINQELSARDKEYKETEEYYSANNELSE